MLFAPDEVWTVDVDGFRPPTMNWVRVELADALSGMAEAAASPRRRSPPARPAEVPPGEAGLCNESAI